MLAAGRVIEANDTRCMTLSVALLAPMKRHVLRADATRCDAHDTCTASKLWACMTRRDKAASFHDFCECLSGARPRREASASTTS